MNTTFQVNSSAANVTPFYWADWLTNVSEPSFYDEVTDLRPMTTTMMTASMTSTETPAAAGDLTLTERLFMLTKDQRQQAEDIMLYIRYVIYAVSLPLTTCNVAVFLRPNMRSATSVYIVGISLAQLLYIVTNIVSSVLNGVVTNRMNNYGYLVYNIYISSYLSIVMLRAAYVIMCYVSLERLYAVLKPFHVKEFVLTRYPIPFIVATFIFSALMHVYMLVQTFINQVTSSRTGKQIYMMDYTDLYKNDPKVADAFGSAAPILLTYIPLLTLLLLNLLTVWALKRHNVSTQRVQSTSSEEEKRLHERQMTWTILGTSACYVVLSLPYACHILVKNALPEYDKRQKYENLYYVMRSFGFTLTLLSFATDFVCFFVLSTAYRKTFLGFIRVTALRSTSFKKKPDGGIEPEITARTVSSDMESSNN